MKEIAKRILKRMRIYHPLQSLYRSVLEYAVNKYYKLTYSKFKGNGFTCNFCNASYRNFVPEYPSPNIADAIHSNAVIAGYGKNVFCPDCMSKNRERLLLAVMQHMIVVKNKTILHFSPEKLLFNYLKKEATVTTVDIMPGFYKKIDHAISFSDATNLHFKDESFDMVIANHILEHIPEDLKAMKEMYRVLKSGGMALLQVPYSEKLNDTIEDPYIDNPALQEQLYGQKDHVRIYALTNYLDRLSTAGFRIKVLNAEVLEQFKNFAIQDGEKVIICYK
jgi:predicted SAM-dependent methyltransferase